MINGLAEKEDYEELEKEIEGKSKNEVCLLLGIPTVSHIDTVLDLIFKRSKNTTWRQNNLHLCLWYNWYCDTNNL